MFSERLRGWRAERPDEWVMDEFIREAENMDKIIKMFVETLECFADICPATGEDAEYMAEDSKQTLIAYRNLLNDYPPDKE